ncbi:hypothetical protein SAMN05216328_12483 [Ensifer sp. YR511]|nr:hypothetical protein SAMN05216328_12483 [Ensifer sp. YR511]
MLERIAETKLRVRFVSAISNIICHVFERGLFINLSRSGQVVR